MPREKKERRGTEASLFLVGDKWRLASPTSSPLPNNEHQNFHNSHLTTQASEKQCKEIEL